MTLSRPTNPLEDKIGKIAMIAIFGFMAYQALQSLMMIVLLRAEIPFWGLALISQLVGTAFLALILFYTIKRLPPRDSAAGFAPRAVAIMGTFIMSALIVMPPESIGAPMRIVSSGMIILGTGLSIWCLHQLGRSFSIMATARELKTTGSYGVVRHPLYGAEVLMILGVVLSHGTWMAYGVGVLWLALQIRRAQYEEAVLRATFPHYTDYARRVPMLIPGLHLTWIEQGLLMKSKQA
jgi:protein-S-isoprenylcysteine O-methyltransferase Ste14